MNINKIQYKSRLLTLLLFALFNVVGYAQDTNADAKATKVTLKHQKGASGRELDSVMMYLNDYAQEKKVKVNVQAVHEMRQIIYVPENGTAHFQIQATHDVNYFRWFRYDTNVKLRTYSDSYGFTSIVPKNASYDCDKNGLIYKGTTTVLEVATYTIRGTLKRPIEIACDISYNTDGEKDDAGNYTEPTLSYRMIYELRNASEMATALTACTTKDKCLERYDMIAPTGREIILAPKYPFTNKAKGNGFYSNYYIEDDKLIDGACLYRLTDDGLLTYEGVDGVGDANGRQMAINDNSKLNIVRTPGLVHYVLKTGGWDTNPASGYYIARFDVEYRDPKDVGPLAEEEMNKNHQDAYLQEHYREIAARRFDFNDAEDAYRNWAEPLDFEESTYPFRYRVYNDDEPHSKYTPVCSSSDKEDAVLKLTPWDIGYGQYAFLSSSKRIGSFIYRNIDDRKYINSKKLDSNNAKRGYFYYVDASEIQGTVSKLDITNAYCPGANLYLSAWVLNGNCQTGKVPANLNLEVIASEKGKEDRVIKTLTTGSFDRGKEDPNYSNANSYWRKVFFNFKLFSNTKYDKLSFRVANNQLSSSGNDFIIDDIVVYAENPAVNAEQTKVLCGNEAEMKVHVNYEQLLRLCGMDSISAGSPSIPIGCCFLDSAAYQSAIGGGTSQAEAFKNALVHLTRSNVGDEDDNIFQKFLLYGKNDMGKYTSSAGMDNKQLLDLSMDTSPYVAISAKEDGDHTLDFIVTMKGDDLVAGKTYYAILNIEGDDASIKDITNYDIGSRCTPKATFKLKGAVNVVVDGVTDLIEQGGTFCSNVSPTFHVNKLYYILNNELKELETDNVSFDWFQGSKKEYYDQNTHGNEKFSVHDALMAYRSNNPTGNNVSVNVDGKYTEEMSNLLTTLTTNGEGNNATLVLNKINYSPKLTEQKEYVFFARPVAATIIDGRELAICLDEQQIIYNATNVAPSLDYGLPNVTYTGQSILPIRASMEQLKDVTDTQPIIVPIREVNTTTPGSTELGVDKNHQSSVAYHDELFLIDTDDPNMRDYLGKSTQIGTVMAMYAKTGKNNKNDIGQQYKNYLTFYWTENFRTNIREGYTYDMKFFFREKDAVKEEFTNACSGNSTLRFKVVPEYENWTGAANNNNWCNDDNWERSDGADDIYKTNGYNNNKTNGIDNGFVPLRFTNITIKEGSTNTAVPFLEKHALTSNGVLNLENGTTKDIAYDMTLEEETGYTYKPDITKYYNCHLFYENWCKDIYLKPEAEIMNAQHLKYTTAHVDYELTPNRWYLLSSPLKAVYAGDMYAPTGTARQETDAFAAITYDKNKNNRFNPAVYQRSWDKKSSLIYDKDGNERNVYIRANWSNVYNDVEVPYLPGTGFSIKACPKDEKIKTTLFRLPKADAQYTYYTSGGDEAKPALTQNVDKENSGILFTDDFVTDETELPVEVTNDYADNKLMLVGNPFPCQLDMFNFLNANKGVLESGALKYYIMTAGTMNAAIFTEKGALVSTVASPDVATGATVTPMQGFFVKASGNSATFKFTPAMMTGQYSGISSPGLHAPKQQTDKEMLRLTATADNGSSTALLVRSTTASDAFVDAEDVEAIDNSLTRDIPMVYSIAGNTAAQINQFCSERMIPVGVINGTTESTPVKVTGTDTFNGTVSIYDAMLNTTTPLQEGDNITMLNNVSGRYYISLGEATSIDNTASTSISITSPAVGVLQVVSSPSTPLTDVKVYLPNGALVASGTSLNKSTVTLNVPSAMYIVRAVTCGEQRVVKIMTK